VIDVVDTDLVISGEEEKEELNLQVDRGGDMIIDTESQELDIDSKLG